MCVYLCITHTHICLRGALHRHTHTFLQGVLSAIIILVFVTSDEFWNYLKNELSTEEAKNAKIADEIEGLSREYVEGAEGSWWFWELQIYVGLRHVLDL